MEQCSEQFIYYLSRSAHRIPNLTSFAVEFSQFSDVETSTYVYLFSRPVNENKNVSTADN